MIAPPAAPAAAPTGPPTTAPVAAPAAAPFPAGVLHPSKAAIRNVNAENAITRHVFILVKTVLRAALSVIEPNKRSPADHVEVLSRRNIPFFAVDVNIEPLTLDLWWDSQPDCRPHDCVNDRGSDDS